MKRILLALAATPLGLASASAIPQFENPVTLVNTTLFHSLMEPVHIDFAPCPEFANESPIYNITEITLDPHPIKKKKSVHIVVRGELHEKTGQGASAAIVLQELKGKKRHHQWDYDFCKGILKGCPVDPGETEWWTGQHISRFVRRALRPPDAPTHLQLKIRTRSLTRLAL